MRVFDTADHSAAPADPKTFTGKATLARMDRVSDDPRVNVYRVTFQPAARTHWHIHRGTQILLVVAGHCRVQKAGEPVRQVASGGVVSIGSGEKHWHGASPDEPMTHVAINIDASTEWLEPVTDGEYDGHP